MRTDLQRGLSLVELMVSLAIGLFLLAGAVSVFGKTRDLYRTNDSTARLQETARYAMSTIEADLRMANHWGLMSRAEFVANGPALSAAPPAVDPAYALPATLASHATVISSCGAMWAVKLPAYVEATDAYSLTCAAFGGAVPDSDQLTVRRVSTQVITAAQLGSTNGRIKLQTSRMQGSLFANTTLPVGFSALTSETRALVANGYYVDVNSDQTVGTPSLRRKQLDAAGNAPVINDREVVPGVEDLQIEYGVDLDADQNVDYFIQPGTAVPVGDEIVAVRVWLLVRSETPEFPFVDERTYTYANRAAYAPADNFRRVLVSKTIALRNTRR